MKAITVRQPYASLIAIGAKSVETRGWRTHYRGPVMIHAGASMSPTERHYCRQQPFRDVLVENGGDTTLRPLFEPASCLPLGQVVAVADLVDVLTTENLACMFEEQREGVEAPVHVRGPVRITTDQRVVVELPQYEQWFGNYEPNRYGFLLANVQRLENPVPARGKLNLWTPDDDVQQRVLAQVQR